MAISEHNEAKKPISLEQAERFHAYITAEENQSKLRIQYDQNGTVKVVKVLKTKTDVYPFENPHVPGRALCEYKFTIEGEGGDLFLAFFFPFDFYFNEPTELSPSIFTDMRDRGILKIFYS